MPKSWSNSFVTRLAGTFFGLLLAVVIVLSLTAYLRTREFLVQAVNDQLSQSATAKESALNRWIQEEIFDIETMSRTPGLRYDIEMLVAGAEQGQIFEESYERLYQYVQDIVEAGDDIREIFILTGTGGQIILSTDQTREGDYRVNDQYFANGKIETYLQPVYPSPDTLQPTVTISTPVQGESGEMIAVLAVHLDLDQMDEIVRETASLTIPNQVYLVDSNNVLVSPQMFGGDQFPRGVHSAGIDAAISQQEGVLSYTNYEEVPVLGAFRWVDELNMALLVEVPEEAAFAASRQQLYLTILIGFGLAVYITLGIWLVARRISAPILAVTQTAQKIADGDFSQKVPVLTQDEVGDLAIAFNDMASQLRDLIENLEHRVQVRTHHLKIASDVSRQVTTVLDIDDLLPQLTELTNEGFDLSHTTVFLFNEETGKLRLVAVAGAQAEAIKKKDIELDITTEDSIVARAADLREPIIVNDVATAEIYRHIPELEGTRSEVALPMIFGGKLLGILDLQAIHTNHFTPEQLDVLVSLAEQIAVAVRNASLYSELQTALEEARIANVAKSQFLASVSHELRTPLNSVLNFTQFVGSGMIGPVNERQVDMLDKAVSSARHLLSLINDVLDISKIESGALNLFIENDVNMAEEVDSVVATAQGMLAGKSVLLTTEIENNLPLVSADRRRIQQVMLNLVSNACKFTAAGKVNISLSREDDNIRFAVTDTGPGVAMEDRELIFETFGQTEASVRTGGGTGLGLPISLRLVKAHGGHLGFESTVDVGSTFYFTIPITNPETLDGEPLEK